MADHERDPDPLTPGRDAQTADERDDDADCEFLDIVFEPEEPANTLH